MSAIRFDGLALTLIQILRHISRFIHRFLEHSMSGLRPKVLSRYVITSNIRRINFTRSQSTVSARQIRVLAKAFNRNRYSHANGAIKVTKRRKVGHRILVRVDLKVTVRLLLASQRLQLNNKRQFPQYNCQLYTVKFFARLNSDQEGFQEV